MQGIGLVYSDTFVGFLFIIMESKLSLKAIAIFVILAIIWGTSFLLIKRGLTVFSPIQLGSLRIVLTFLALSPFAFKHLRKTRLRDWLLITFSGSLGSLFPAYLFAYAQQGLNSATAGILNSLTPLFALLIGVLFFKFSAKWWNYIGIAITTYGTYMLLAVSGGNSFDFNFTYGIYIIIATVGYGIQVNLVRYYLNHIPAFTIVIMQFFAIVMPAAIVLFFFTDFTSIIFTHPNFLSGLLYIGILAVVGTAFALIMFYKLVKWVDPVFSSSVTYFIPAVATLWGILDGEMIGLSYFLWVTVILGGVFLVNRKVSPLIFKAKG